VGLLDERSTSVFRVRSNMQPVEPIIGIDLFPQERKAVNGVGCNPDQACTSMCNQMSEIIALKDDNIGARLKQFLGCRSIEASHAQSQTHCPQRANALKRFAMSRCSASAENSSFASEKKKCLVIDKTRLVKIKSR